MSANTIHITPQWIKQEQGGYIAPRTLTSCIQDEDGNSFQEYADKMIIMDEDEIIHPSSDVITSISNQDIYNIVCDKYDPTKIYNLGEYCINNNIAYKCNTTITTPEEFDVSKWTNISIAEEIKALNDDLANKKIYHLTFFDNASGNIVCYSAYNTFFVIGYVTIPANTPDWTPFATGLPINVSGVMYVDSNKNSITTNAGRNYLATRKPPESTDMTYSIFGVIY